MENGMFSLKDKIVLLTGASEGIGAALAKEMASAGAFLILCSRSLEKLRKVEDEIRNGGGKIEFYQLDVMDYTSIVNLKDEIGSRFGKIDVLINNAGYAVTKPTVDISERDFDLDRQFSLMEDGRQNSSLRTPFLLILPKSTIVAIRQPWISMQTQSSSYAE